MRDFNVRYKRTIIHAWTREHECRSRFQCSHCEAQIWGAYTRKVERLECRKFPALEVSRYCRDCM
jgi:hypothetical protein